MCQRDREEIHLPGERMREIVRDGGIDGPAHETEAPGDRLCDAEQLAGSEDREGLQKGLGGGV